MWQGPGSVHFFPDSVRPEKGDSGPVRGRVRAPGLLPVGLASEQESGPLWSSALGSGPSLAPDVDGTRFRGRKFVVTKGNLAQMYHAPGRKREFNVFVLDKTYFGPYDETTCIDWTDDSR